MLKSEPTTPKKATRKTPVPKKAAATATPARKSKTTAEKDLLAVVEPSHAEVARRAYEIFLSRAGSPGSAEEDWLRAERELREERAKTVSRKRVVRTRGGH